LCDFISTVDTPSIWELNIWYHTLNCGYRCRISGETDFPCIYGERVGLGRSYVHLGDRLDFDKWCEGIKDGRCYVSDGKSHLMDFEVNGLGVGQRREKGAKPSELRLAEPGTVKVRAKVAALLEPKPTAETERVRRSPLSVKPYWDLERARIAGTRKVPVEVVVNGVAVDRKEVAADGTEQEVEFAVPIKKSSWVCLRIFPSSHTNPVFVLVGDRPIRASRKSADWCLKAIDRCWEQKVRLIRKDEQPAAKEAYDKAREAYRAILKESAED
ncbi:MAG TPA: CehA/McbA family metallohydrolase, partial [Gemmataceae bacterium]|nr:CehA/McbA family metallohydrolase [Gemmataceae bacterium]